VTDDGRFVLLARFESEEAARRNNARHEQGQWWTETEKYLDGVASGRFRTRPQNRSVTDRGTVSGSQGFPPW
jgi:hypothetical protein